MRHCAKTPRRSSKCRTTLRGWIFHLCTHKPLVPSEETWPTLFRCNVRPKWFWRLLSRGHVKYLCVKRFLLVHLVMCQPTATSTEILLLIYCPLLSSSPVYRLCKVSLPFIRTNNGLGWALRAGRRGGSNWDHDLAETMMYVLFAPPVQAFNTHHAPFNRPLLLSVLTTSLPSPPPSLPPPFYFFLKSLPVNYRLGFIFLPSPLLRPFPPYSVEVAGEESLLV